jgi:spore germination protein GerM
VGDAAAVQVTINGKAVAPLGAHGEVITRRFSRADRVL